MRKRLKPDDPDGLTKYQRIWKATLKRKGWKHTYTYDDGTIRLVSPDGWVQYIHPEKHFMDEKPESAR